MVSLKVIHKIWWSKRSGSSKMISGDATPPSREILAKAYAASELSGDHEVGRRFASINCYLFCLSPGNTTILPSSDLASSLSSAPAEFARTTSHRVAQGYRATTGIDPGPGGSPGPRGPWRVRHPRAGPASDPPGGRPHQPNGTAGIAAPGSPASCPWG
jgi:hypothetical protein